MGFTKNKEEDTFYSEQNLKQIERAEEQIRSGKTVTRTIAELEAMEKEYNYGFQIQHKA